MPLLRRTRAILRNAELGFFGVMVRTTVHTPRFCGEPFGSRMRRCLYVLNTYCSAGALVLLRLLVRPLRTSWLIVGTLFSVFLRQRLDCLHTSRPPRL